MKITAIKAAVKTPGRVNVFVDETYSFSLDESQLLGSGVVVGKEYSEADIEALKEESAFGKAYARALDYILRRPRSEKELRDYAFRKQWEPELRDRVIAKLSEKGYLDDETFAASWVRHRAMGKPMSQRKLCLELQQKGVASDIIEKALAEDETFDENAALKKLIEKKRTRYSDEQKFIAYLVGQGFRYDKIKQALEED